MTKIKIDFKAITLSFLRECFDLHEETGSLIWRARPVSHFRDEADARRINARRVGRVAGVLDKKKTRLRVCVNNRLLMAHRVVFALSRGIDFEDVPPIIDHIDGNSLNNRPCNLREATALQSVHNTGIPRSNTTGFKGVRRAVTEGRFVALIKAGGKPVHLGTFATKEEAAAAYRGAAKIIQGDYMRQGI